MAKSKLFIGVDLGGTNIAAGVVDSNGKVHGRDKVKTKADKGEEAVLTRIAKVVDKAIDDAKVNRDEIGGIGIGAPGAIDYKKGIVVNAVNLRWNNFPLTEELEKETGIKVTLDNDVNVGAWGEFRKGAGKDFDELLAVFVGTGIGGGLIIHGKLYHGHYMSAGEIGHTIVKADAPIGRRSLENCASRTMVANRIRELVLSNHPSKMLDITEGDLDNIRSRALKEAVDAGDALTIGVLKDSARYVGTAIANTVTLMSLPCAVVGGGLIEALGDKYLNWVIEAFEERVFPPELKACKVVASKLGDDAGIVGAALLAADRLG